MTTALNAWMNGELVGTWTVDRATHAFTYAASWIASPKVRSLSLSLPVTASREVRGDVVAHYFDNLLPDYDRIRERLSRRFGTRGTHAFSFLEAIGRDCVGAVQLLPQRTEPNGWNRVDCEPLSERRVEAILRALPAHAGPGAPLQDDDLFRVSIAGAQEKTAFTRHKGRWCRPHGATPTTHIFKLPLGQVGGSRRVDLSDSVQNEWVCAQIVAELGLPMAPTTMARFGDEHVLVVERFDRARMDGGTWIARLPQEVCQALGVPPRRKYEADGGPGMAKCRQLLAGSADPQQDRLAFQLSQLAASLLADGRHRWPRQELLDLPAAGRQLRDYAAVRHPVDVAVLRRGPQPVQPEAGGPRDGDACQERALQARDDPAAPLAAAGDESRRAGGLGCHAGAVVERVEPALVAVDERLPKGFPGRTWEPVAAGMRAQARRFREGAPQA